MMLTADYVALMARYNAWQNVQITRAIDGVSRHVLTKDHGAFFGSILGTLNHILWADRMWLSRFGVEDTRPEGGIAESTTLTPTGVAWSAERFTTDGRIKAWAGRTSPAIWSSIRGPWGPRSPGPWPPASSISSTTRPTTGGRCTRC